jgi:hypothetical protein
MQPLMNVISLKLRKDPAQRHPFIVIGNLGIPGEILRESLDFRSELDDVMIVVGIFFPWLKDFRPPDIGERTVLDNLPQIMMGMGINDPHLFSKGDRNLMVQLYRFLRIQEPIRPEKLLSLWHFPSPLTRTRYGIKKVSGGSTKMGHRSILETLAPFDPSTAHPSLFLL